MDKILGIVTAILGKDKFLELFKGNRQKEREFMIELAEKLQQANFKQMDVNLQESKHRSIWVAGWRPFIGWICGSALAYNFVLQPFIFLILQVFKLQVQLPQLDLSQLISILLAMLGMSAYRTYEKIKLTK